MQKMLRKLLSAAGYIGFFGGFFYILFVNLVCGFASSGIVLNSTKNSTATAQSPQIKISI